MIFPEQSTDEVKLLGDPLGLVLWQGKQWSVTSDGIECRDGTYFISKERVHESWPGYTWLTHLSGKSWVDVDDFADALSVGQQIFDKKGNRTKVKSPNEIDDYDMEQYALQCADKEYKLAKIRFMKGEVA